MKKSISIDIIKKKKGGACIPCQVQSQVFAREVCVYNSMLVLVCKLAACPLNGNTTTPQLQSSPPALVRFGGPGNG